MTIYVNGEKKVFEKEQMSVRELLDALQYKEGFAVALNTTFVLNTTYETTMIKEGDVLDILAPVQGG
ncbi:sulfur carrier protein ThiS [Sulfurovum sp.]|jgi:sulfur carrier protein|uniref:sulfur carrier protein ThiS n=1 Tax=Sulfurovum sp. TaxID=1969726 RepID=UPI002A3661D7|nr:sulfur carrier protein ThiS [Sulfurovum sp.]MDD2450446.1 sulfur carrier protein ThiS [Sulfurovum sp.]MDD3498872.1 sulfur carrier protein ThiS [Sulfurovum sp.]MDY0402109.1 sulfur carrier protein ThiS [Sulfurovum sp.]